MEKYMKQASSSQANQCSEIHALADSTYKHLVKHEHDVTYGTIDTGCQRMAVGADTLKAFAEALPQSLRVSLKKEQHRFRSVHGISTTNHVAEVPSALGPRGSLLKPAVFEEPRSRSAPFLISITFLLFGRAALDLDPERGLTLCSRRFGFTVPCHLGPTGALRVPLQHFTDDVIRSMKLAALADSNGHEEHEVLHQG